ncbi:hypothetical protein ARAM_001475 [Aspergillus rambellii]|uniref:Glycosyl transferase CAP10 domain-containing protein n=1 Tax=Aspergillus rambellii TaxID=308745 RepID=A0A0F8WMS8_9EURO|nr:hypothetical protein ARAM_001475 [Aspergillus rambellii]
MPFMQIQPSWFRFLGAGAMLSLILTAFLVVGKGYSNNATGYVLKTPDRHSSSQGFPGSQSHSCPSSNATWEFVVQRDGNNHGLSEEQCLSAFPKLFAAIDKSAAFRADKLITFQELDDVSIEDGMVRGIVDGGELYVVDFAAMPYTFTRGKATLHSLNRALESFPGREHLPSIEFVLSTDDYSNGKGPVWSYSKQAGDEGIWLMPDFGYWAWPEVNIGSYKDIRRRIAAIDEGTVTPDGRTTSGLQFQEKKKQLAWRGNVATNSQIRGKLVDAAKGKSWASIREINWDGNDDDDDVQRNLLPMEEHCRYMFLAHTEGRSFSGRGKYLLNCRSVVISHKLVWLEAHHAAFISSGPDANYVEVERDFSDLERKIEFLIDNPEAAERIADNAVKTFRDRYLTPAAESCYWRHLIRMYAASCDFGPVLSETQDGEKQSRGVHFEDWILKS